MKSRVKNILCNNTQISPKPWWRSGHRKSAWPTGSSGRWQRCAGPHEVRSWPSSARAASAPSDNGCDGTRPTKWSHASSLRQITSVKINSKFQHLEKMEIARLFTIPSTILAIVLGPWCPNWCGYTRNKLKHSLVICNTYKKVPRQMIK